MSFRPSRGRWSRLLIVLVAMTLATAIHAQDGDRHAGGPRGSAASSERALQTSLKAALSQPAPAQVSASAERTLTFARDSAVSAREGEAFIAHLAKQPGGAGPLEPAIRSGKMLQEFDRLLRRYGYSSRNLGDVLAAHLVICWEIVNESDSNAQPAGQRAVRRQLAGALASVPAIARMSDAQKQGQAERTAYLTMVAGSAYQELKRGGNPGIYTSHIQARFG